MADTGCLDYPEWTPFVHADRARTKAAVSANSPEEEPELLNRARKGDVAAFALLIRSHLPRLRRFAYAFTRHWADADDLAQEALLKAFRSLGSFEGRAQFGTWLYTVTRSVCQDHYRGRAARERRREDPLPDDASEAPGSSPLQPDALLSRKDDAERLWLHVKALPPAFRVPLVLYEIEGMAYEDIAKIERVPICTIRSRLSRAREQLRERLTTSEPAAPSAPPGTVLPVRSSNPGSAVR